MFTYGFKKVASYRKLIRKAESALKQTPTLNVNKVKTIDKKLNKDGKIVSRTAISRTNYATVTPSLLLRRLRGYHKRPTLTEIKDSLQTKKLQKKLDKISPKRWDTVSGVGDGGGSRVVISSLGGGNNSTVNATNMALRNYYRSLRRKDK